jgi:hypothetical protein
MKNNTIKYFIGVDVSKNKLDIYHHPIGKFEQILNEEKAIKALAKNLKKNRCAFAHYL